MRPPRPLSSSTGSRPWWSRGRRPGAALVAIALILTACGASGTAVHSSFGPTSGPKLESGPTYEVKLGNVGGLGPVLGTGQGLTLYLFEPDHQSRSTCGGLCAVQWPPL